MSLWNTENIIVFFDFFSITRDLSVKKNLKTSKLLYLENIGNMAEKYEKSPIADSRIHDNKIRK